MAHFFVFCRVNGPCCYQSAVCFGGRPAGGGRAPILWRGNCYTVAPDCRDLSPGASRGSLFPIASADSLITNHLIDLMSASCLLITVLIPSVNLCCD